MRSNFTRYFLGILLAAVLLAGAFSGGLITGMALPDKAAAALQIPGIPFQGTPTPVGTPVSRDAVFAPFWQAWDLVHQEYVDQPVNDIKLMQGAIRGMLASLGDQHTSFMDPNQFRQQKAPLQGGYEGIGAWVDITGPFVTITRPMPGSPAEKAGLKPGDAIHKVDGKDMTGIEGSLVLRQILGPAGTTVVLSILRKDQKDLFDISIVRGTISVPSVQGKMLEGNIAYIQLLTFGDKTTEDLKKQLTTLLANKPRGLIFDLRDNGGGYLNTAIEVVSQFIGKGTVMYEQYGDGTRKTFESLPGGIATDIPLVVLVNENTASASEITAGAIQDTGRGKLVGVTTYGKGSVQNLTELKNAAGAVRITVARWLTPKERQINSVGLKPDFEIKITDTDRQAGKDPQLDNAVQLLLGNTAQIPFLPSN